MDEFGFKAPDIGTLTHARIRHDNSGMGPGWHLHKVEVQSKTKGWQLELSPQDLWLDTGEGDRASIVEGIVKR